MNIDKCVVRRTPHPAPRYKVLPSGKFNPLMFTVKPVKPQSNGPLYSNTVISTLAVDGWAVTFGTARRGLGGLRPHPVPSSLYQM